MVSTHKKAYQWPVAYGENYVGSKDVIVTVGFMESGWMMVNFREIMPCSGRKIQVSELNF